MGITTTLLPSITKDHHHPIQFSEKPNYLNSMSSQDYQQGILSFANGGLERSHQQQQQQHMAYQIRRDKLRVQGFEPPPSLVAMEGEDSSILSAYETAGTLSEMFNFPSRTTAATELLANQIQASYRTTSRPPPTGEGSSQSYGVDRQGLVVVGGGSKDHNLVDVDGDSVTLTTHHQHQISRINGDTAAAMQLFLMNPQPKSPSPSYLTSISSTLHRLRPNPSYTSPLQEFHNTTSPSGGHFGPSQFTWVPPDHRRHEEDLATAAQLNNHSEIRSIVEGQGLSLSLSSSLQHFESAAAKAEELRMGEGEIMFFNNENEGPTASQYQSKNLLQGNELNNQNHLVHIGFGTSLSTVNVLRNSKYVKAGQELLEEFCSADRGQFKKSKLGRKNNSNPSSNPSGGGGGCSSSSSKDFPPLSAADKLEHNRRKVKLLSMLDEVDRRYNHYCKQMQMVVNSFDLVMGLGAAVPYTALAQKAMSRHFKCIKDAISIQLKHSCEFLGEKDGISASRGVTKGETPRLRLLEQSLRQQKAFYQMDLMEQEAWRPQRGLPERSVNILRAWLLEHFLNPYPSDADKHLLARQTGLSRSQVSNWFINARVRLWKPMIEEMYEQESKEEDTADRGGDGERNQNSDPTQTQAAAGNRESDHSNSSLINTQQCLSENKGMRQTTNTIMAAPSLIPSVTQSLPALNACHRGSSDFGTTATATGIDEMGSSRFIHFGTINPEDVSLTLGLRRAGNLPDNSSFTVRDFDKC